jgi:hypothetical protein
MLTKALAVVGSAVISASLLGPSVASTESAAANPTQPAPAAALLSDGDNLRAWVQDRTRRDHHAREYNAQGIWIYPHLRRGWLYVQVKGQTLRPSRRFNAAYVYLQTRGDRRPDYRIVHNLPRDGDGLAGTYIERIRGWDASGTTRRCGRLSAKWRVNARVVEFDIPRRCIRRQGRVRVNAETWNYTRYRANGSPRRGVYDPVPARHALSGWH